MWTHGWRLSGTPFSCEFTTKTKQQCANALCVAQGYTSGEFKEGDDFCKRSIDNVWGFDLRTNKIKYFDSNNGLEFSAKCF